MFLRVANPAIRQVPMMICPQIDRSRNEDMKFAARDNQDWYSGNGLPDRYLVMTSS
ncbi:MAG: hypothetical protein J7J52_00630 [Deltaproteobacteria bacterium]|nr:hypothetical protein [Deltaproteobacteria bacterium]